jgi:hypothetical protein
MKVPLEARSFRPSQLYFEVGLCPDPGRAPALASGFGCGVTDTSVTTRGVNMTGTCQPTKCFGKKGPGNCNGGNNDQCSRTPWVRLLTSHGTGWRPDDIDLMYQFS